MIRDTTLQYQNDNTAENLFGNRKLRCLANIETREKKAGDEGGMLPLKCVEGKISLTQGTDCLLVKKRIISS